MTTRTFQSFNKKTKRWVKWKFEKGKSIILDVKQREPVVPFKGVKIK